MMGAVINIKSKARVVGSIIFQMLLREAAGRVGLSVLCEARIETKATKQSQLTFKQVIDGELR
jgi:hypothetical protein